MQDLIYFEAIALFIIWEQRNGAFSYFLQALEGKVALPPKAS